MTRFTVTWLDDARDELARLWMGAWDRQAVTHAANSIDRLLEIDPELRGIEVGDGCLMIYEPPLHVLYRIRELDRIVEVTHVRSDDTPETRALRNGRSYPAG